MADDKRKKLEELAVRLRDNANYLIVESQAILRMLDELRDAEEVPTVRPKSGSMEAVKVEIVKLPGPRRQR